LATLGSKRGTVTPEITQAAVQAAPAAAAAAPAAPVIPAVTVLPDPTQGMLHTLMTPLSWMVDLQNHLLNIAWSAGGPGGELAKRIFLLLPMLSVVVGLWCTTLSAYTLLFRSGRIRYVATLAVLWWDVVRSAWHFWIGAARFLWIALGTVYGLVHLIAAATLEMIKELFELPFVLSGTITRNLSQPGVPWLAFMLTVAWSGLEALVFTYVLSPTMGQVISDITGVENHRFLGPFLFVMLVPMVAGSLACMHVLLDSIKNKNYTQVLQMIVVEFFVMFVEVMFLYRELVDSLTPWISQQTGMHMGLVPVILLATFSWMGVRAMVWFLFARYGTPTLLALISRQALPEETAKAASATVSASEERLGLIIGKLKAEQAWFHGRADSLVEAAVLPIFQVIASGLNFCFVLLLSKPLYNLPFKGLGEVGDTKTLLRSVAGLEHLHEAFH
jgi:hypothetical protein